MQTYIDPVSRQTVAPLAVRKPAVIEWERSSVTSFPTRLVGYAASQEALYRTEDGGEHWRKLALVPGGRVHVLNCPDELAGWLKSDS